jgi:hypothetical protein
MLSENENVMIIENEHEIYFNGISMEEVVKGSLRTKISKTRNCNNCMFKGKCGKVIIEVHYVGLSIVLMMEKMLKGESSNHEMCHLLQ